jgi:coenzyme PQQ precursor peptide PqqA
LRGPEFEGIKTLTRLAPLLCTEDIMTWTKPEFEIVELGMEVGAYAGNA